MADKVHSEEVVTYLTTKLKISQSRMAKEIGVSHTLVSKWKRKQATISPRAAIQIYLIFKVLVVDVFPTEEKAKEAMKWIL